MAEDSEQGRLRLAADVTLRPLESQDDFRQCLALQYETWGDGFGEAVPPSILLVTQKVGGVAAGAFAPDGRLLGFVFGVSGVRQGRLAHWSDMLAVRRDERGLGLGKRLKVYQRELLLASGIDVAYWSYDPLVARNAHININRLGALPVEYVENMYGDVTGSTLHAGLGTDRFVVEWPLRDPRVEAALSGERHEPPGEPPVVNTEPGGGIPLPKQSELPDSRSVRVEIPADIQTIKLDAPESARAWRESTRRALLHYLGCGLAVVGLQRDRATGRYFYVLERS